MKQRCLNPKHKGYFNYGGRGITICQRWLDSFSAFLEDMGPRTSPMHSIQRKENDKGYFPGNCCWATRKEQMANTRQHLRLEAFGRVQTAREWEKELGLKHGSVAGYARCGKKPFEEYVAWRKRAYA